MMCFKSGSFIATWINPKCILLKKRGQTERLHVIWFYLWTILEKVKQKTRLGMFRHFWLTTKGTKGDFKFVQTFKISGRGGSQDKLWVIKKDISCWQGWRKKQIQGTFTLESSVLSSYCKAQGKKLYRNMAWFGTFALIVTGQQSQAVNQQESLWSRNNGKVRMSSMILDYNQRDQHACVFSFICLSSAGFSIKTGICVAMNFYKYRFWASFYWEKLKTVTLWEQKSQWLLISWLLIAILWSEQPGLLGEVAISDAAVRKIQHEPEQTCRARK